MKGSYTHITRYVGREFLFSTLVSFLFFFFIFFINQMLLLAEEILAKKVPFIDVALLIFYSLPAIIALSFPFAALVGCLMAVGKFSSSNEIIAFQASGVSLRKIFFPIITLGILFSSASFIMNDYFLPIGTLNFGRLYRKLLYSHPELEIEGYSVKNFQDSIITTGKVGQEGIQGLLIIDKEPEGNKRIITAGNARVDKDREGVIGLVLEDVVIHSLHKKEKDRYSYTFAEGMVYSILIKNISMAFRSPGPREMSSIDVFKEIQKKRAVLSARRADTVNKIFSLEHEYIQNYRLLVERLFSGEITLENAKENLTRLAAQMKTEGERKIQDRSLQIHLIEFYKKFSIPFSCIPFVILAFPIGLFTRRSGRSVGFGVGLFVSIFYWGMLVAGQTLGIRADFSPLFSMWVPNFVILILGISAFIMRFRG